MTTFHTPRNGVSTTVAAARSVGAVAVTVADGTPFGSTFPLIVTATRAGAVLCILEVNGRAGDVLTVSGAIEGTTDTALQVGDTLEMRPTALAITELQEAIGALEASAGMAIGGAVSGGNAGEVLFVGNGGVLSQASGLTYSGGTLMSAGDLLLDPTGSGASSPRTFGFTALPGGSAVRLQFGDGNNGIQYAPSEALQIYSYAQIEFRASEHFGPPPFVGATTDLGVRFTNTLPGTLAVVITAAAGQSAPLEALQGLSSTGSARDLGYLDAGFSVATDASYTGYVRLCAQDYHAATGGREGVRVGTDGTQPLLGFYGATPVARAATPTTLDDVIAILKNLGLCT